MTSATQRRWYAFRLRTLLVVILFLGVTFMPLAVKVKNAREQKKIVAWVLKNHGEVEFDQQTPRWFRWLVGDDSFRTVRSVRLEGGRVDDLTPLRKMTGLRELHVTFTRVSDLSPISRLTDLRTLHVSGTQVSDLSPLRRLTQLKQLNLLATRPSDLSAIRNLTNLEVLGLYATQATDLKPLKELKKLRELDLHFTMFTDEEVARLQKALPHCKITR